MEQFLQWAKERGLKADALRPQYDKDSGWGLYATRSIRENQPLLVIPNSLIIRASMLSTMTPYKDILERYPKFLLPFDLLVLFIAHEAHIGAKSQFKPYIDILPKYLMTPIADKEFPAEALPRHGRECLLKQRAEFDKCRERLVVPWRYLHSNLLTTEHYTWSWYIVNTRCVWTENEPCELLDTSHDGDTISLMPYFDFLNHSSENKTNYNYSKKERSLTLSSDYTIIEGRQVFITYGSHTNQRLLIEYGFTVDDSSTEHVQLTIGDVEILCTVSDLHWCEKHGDVLHKAELKASIWQVQSAPSWSILATCYLLNIPCNELDRWRDVFNIDDFEENEPALKTCVKLLRALLKWEEQEAARAHQLMLTYESNSGKHPLHSTTTIDNIWQTDIRIVQQCIEQTEELLEDLHKSSPSVN